MLSGDKSTVVKFVAKELGVDNAFGYLLPEDKVNRVKKLKARGESVAFVGDGVNDAPVVALSDVGIAMGGLGSDATIELPTWLFRTTSQVRYLLPSTSENRPKRLSGKTSPWHSP